MVFFWLIVLQVAVFGFLNIPSPVSWRAKLIKFISTNTYVRIILRYHLWLCIISAFFFYDMYGTEKSFLNEVLNIKQQSDGNIATGNHVCLSDRAEKRLSVLYYPQDPKEWIYHPHADLCLHCIACVFDDAPSHVYQTGQVP